MRHIAFVLIAILLTGCAQTGGTDEPVKLGFIGPLTGTSSVLGKNLERGVTMAVEEVNAQGGIGGRPLEIIFEDGKCDGKTASSALQRILVNKPIPAVILGCSPEVLAVAPVLEAEHIVGFSSFATNPRIKDAGDYIFRNVPNDELQARIGADLILEHDYKRVAALHVQHDYGVGLRDALRASLGTEAQIVASEIYEPGSADFRTQLTKIKASDPDVLYLVAFPIEGSVILRQATELGIDAPIIAAEAIKDPSVLPDARNYAGSLTITVPSGQGPGYAAFAAKYEERYGEEPGIYAAESYDGVKILAKALAADGTAQGTKDFLYSMTPYEGASGVTSFDANGEITQVTYDLFTVENGAFVKIGTR
jgi:branched-chain amino acid transport system substrate-binding protein